MDEQTVAACKAWYEAYKVYDAKCDVYDSLMRRWTRAAVTNVVDADSEPNGFRKLTIELLLAQREMESAQAVIPPAPDLV